MHEQAVQSYVRIPSQQATYLGVVLERLRVNFAVAQLLYGQRQTLAVDNGVPLTESPRVLYA